MSDRTDTKVCLISGGTQSSPKPAFLVRMPTSRLSTTYACSRVGSDAASSRIDNILSMEECKHLAAKAGARATDRAYPVCPVASRRVSAVSAPFQRRFSSH